MANLIKKIYLSLFCRKPFVRVCKIGRGSYVREKRTIFGGKYITIGDNTHISSFNRLCCFNRYGGQDYSPTISIGNNCFINKFCTILSAGELIIGNNVLIASHVFITNENHGMNPERNYNSQPLCVKAVRICDFAWIGENALIMPGVTIGEHSIIGAGSVVTKSIPPYCIAVGNPAVVIKRYNKNSQTWEKEEKH